jgi:hypothetical protein
MRLIDGLAEWWSDLGKIYMTPEVRGIERTFDLIICALKIATLSQIIQFFWGRRDQGSTGGLGANARPGDRRFCPWAVRARRGD